FDCAQPPRLLKEAPPLPPQQPHQEAQKGNEASGSSSHTTITVGLLYQRIGYRLKIVAVDGRNRSGRRGGTGNHRWAIRPRVALRLCNVLAGRWRKEGVGAGGSVGSLAPTARSPSSPLSVVLTFGPHPGSPLGPA
ncbi:peptide hydrolase, partial [Trypanosoma cruzi]